VLAGALVLADVIHPAGSVDRSTLRWHVAVWDLWFLVWGILLALVTVAYWRRTAGRSVARPGRSQTESPLARSAAGDHLLLDPGRRPRRAQGLHRRADRARGRIPLTRPRTTLAHRMDSLCALQVRRDALGGPIITGNSERGRGSDVSRFRADLALLPACVVLALVMRTCRQLVMAGNDEVTDAAGPAGHLQHRSGIPGRCG
jgi:hypothetical protein